MEWITLRFTQVSHIIQILFISDEYNKLLLLTALVTLNVRTWSAMVTARGFDTMKLALSCTQIWQTVFNYWSKNGSECTHLHTSTHKPEKWTLCDCASVQVVLSYPKLGRLKRKCKVMLMWLDRTRIQRM